MNCIGKLFIYENIFTPGFMSKTFYRYWVIFGNDKEY